MNVRLELSQDMSGNLVGVLFSKFREAIAQIEILKPDTEQNHSNRYRVFLNNGFIGDHASERNALDFVLKLAERRFAAGTVGISNASEKIPSFGNYA